MNTSKLHLHRMVIIPNPHSNLKAVVTSARQYQPLKATTVGKISYLLFAYFIFININLYKTYINIIYTSNFIERPPQKRNLFMQKAISIKSLDYCSVPLRKTACHKRPLFSIPFGSFIGSLTP